MLNHNTDQTSESEEMYILTIARHIESGETAIMPIPQLAQALEIQPVSVNQMVRKLAEAGLVHYLPYKGVRLTKAGQKVAYHFLRFRRLWEVFLTRHLHYSAVEATDLACDLEHASTEELAERLSAFLENPAISPSGKPIPHLEADQIHYGWPRLNELNIGETAEVLQLLVDPATQSYLASEGLRVKSQLLIESISGNKAMLVKIDGKAIHLMPSISASICVKAIPALDPIA